MAGAIPYSRAPKPSEEEMRMLELHAQIRNKEITMEEAVKMGYKDPFNRIPWGLSDLERKTET